jgi:hypothetical protein
MKIDTYVPDSPRVWVLEMDAREYRYLRRCLGRSILLAEARKGLSKEVTQFAEETLEVMNKRDAV